MGLEGSEIPTDINVSLEGDSLRVRESSSVYEALGEKVFRFEATPQEVMDIWKSTDPLREDDFGMLYGLKDHSYPGLKNRLQDYIDSKAWIYQRAAITLLTSIYRPDLFRENSKPWFTQLKQGISRKQVIKILMIKMY
jgi:hypothetical protein